MNTKLAELAALVDGTLLGDGDLLICGAGTLADVQEGQITLLDGSEKHRDLSGCSAAAAVVPRDFRLEGIAAIEVDDVHRAFTVIVAHFRPQRQATRVGISPQAAVSPSAKLADNVDVHPLAFIGDDVKIGAGSTIHSGARVMAGSQIGEDVTVYPNAVLYENTVVGSRSVIHAGAVLGAYGFGYALVEGRHELSAQLGNVELGDDVEIGAGTTIDRGTYGPTRIGDGTKVDDLVMIAHNCRIGRHNMLCSQVGIAGSTSTGDYVVMAGQVGVRDHVHIGNGAVLGAMSGITNDVPDGSRMIGIPATPEREQKIRLATLSKLPEMRRQLKTLQRVVDRLAEEAVANEAALPGEETPPCRVVA